MPQLCFKNMIIQKLKKGENINSALKKFKVKVGKSRMLKELRERQQFTKPSILKRKQKQKAIYIQKIRTEEQK